MTVGPGWHYRWSDGKGPKPSPVPSLMTSFWTLPKLCRIVSVEWVIMYIHVLMTGIYLLVHVGIHPVYNCQTSVYAIAHSYRLNSNINEDSLSSIAYSSIRELTFRGFLLSPAFNTWKGGVCSWRVTMAYSLHIPILAGSFISCWSSLSSP